MKVDFVLAVLSVLVVTASNAAPTPPESQGSDALGVGQKTLASARANLTSALQRIEVDPPKLADLDAVAAAAGVLKDAIDSGAELEPKDLDYAKSALAARKEVRGARERVEQRRTALEILRHRQAVDGALARLNDCAQRLEGSDGSAKAFDEGREAADALDKAIREARPLAKQDPKLESYLTEAEATAVRQLKAMDERQTALALKKYRPLLQVSRQALADAMAPLGRGATEAQFEGAKRAAVLLSKRLDEGKDLEPKDEPYRTDTDQARSELAEARRRMDEVWNEIGLERMQAEIEPARKDLLGVAEQVAAKDATDDQIAEARTAAIVVRKVLEKFQAQGGRNRAAESYVAAVNKDLLDVEAGLQRRSVDSSRANLAGAVRSIEKRDPTEAQFEEATAALAALEKTLDAVSAKSPELSRSIADARTLARTTRALMANRRLEIAVQEQRAKVEDSKRNAGAAVGEAQKPHVTTALLQEAEDSVKKLQTTLEQGTGLARKDRGYAEYARKVKERIADLKGRVAKRRISFAAEGSRALLTNALTAAKAKLDKAQEPTALEADVEAAAQAVLALEQTLEVQAPVERQDRGYAAFASTTRRDLRRLGDSLELAKQARTFRLRTVEALSTGAAAADSAPAAKGLRAQKDLYGKAVEQFTTCEREGNRMLEETAALAEAIVLVEGRPNTPRAVIGFCAEKRLATQTRLNEVGGLIAFEEGPRRSYEAGTGLAAKGKKTEALAQFDECVATGRILEHDNPEVRERKFEVAGSQVTLAEVVRQCFLQQKTLRP